MGFGAAVATCFNKYANFNGRARRSEYWWWFLFVILLSIGVSFVAGIADAAAGTKSFGSLLSVLLDLALLLPNIAVAVRRLHDLNRSGWWYAGPVVIVLFMLALAVPVFIRIAQNRTNGYDPMDGVPSSAFIIIGLLGFVEAVYGIVLLVWFCMRGTNGQNRFGPDPIRNF